MSSPVAPPLLVFSLSVLLSILLCSSDATTFKGIDLENPVIDVTPSPLTGYNTSSSHGSKDVLLCESVRVAGQSRLELGSYASAYQVSIFLLLGIVVAGAALGCWLEWKFVISDGGSMDVGVAQFVKWATRVIAATFIFQVAIVFMLINSVIMLHLHISGPNGNQYAYLWATRVIAATFIFQRTLDTPLVMGALASCLSICFLITSFKWNGPDSTITFGNSIYSANGNPWRTIGRANVRQNRAEFLSRSGMVASRGTLWNNPRRSSGWSDSPVKGMISLTTGRVTRNQQDYYSTFHRTPNRKKFSKERENITQESTRHAVAELASSPKFTDWIIKHVDRI